MQFIEQNRLYYRKYPHKLAVVPMPWYTPHGIAKSKKYLKGWDVCAFLKNKLKLKEKVDYQPYDSHGTCNSIFILDEDAVRKTIEHFGIESFKIYMGPMVNPPDAIDPTFENYLWHNIFTYKVILNSNKLEQEFSWNKDTWHTLIIDWAKDNVFGYYDIKGFIIYFTNRSDVILFKMFFSKYVSRVETVNKAAARLSLARLVTLAELALEELEEEINLNE